jgi:hypothetical protein
VWEGGAGGVEPALDVDGDHAVPLLGVRAGDRAREHQAGIVDQRVQPPKSPGGLLDGRLGLDAVGDVGFYGQRGAARLADLGGGGVQAVPATGNQRDRSTVLGESAGGSSAIPLLAPVTRAAVPASFASMGSCPVLWMYPIGLAAGRHLSEYPCRCLRGSRFA